MLGKHTLKADTRTQAELYAALGASEAKGVQSLMLDLGFTVKPVLAIDAKATEHTLSQARNRKTEAQRCGVFVGAG